MDKKQPRFYFFSGKGGTGKTTMACATAVHFAESGKKTLIVTTDPASNLADVFEQPLGASVVPVKGVKNLFAMELDPDEATREYKERSLAPLRDILPPDSLAVIEEQLNSPCTSEVAAFERFTDFLQQPEYDAVIFDTAPTGHTLRLIQLPGEWSSVIENAAKDGAAGQTCVGPATALAESKKKFDRALEAMKSPEESDFIFVLRPEATSIYETKHSVEELKKLGISSQELIINGLFPAAACDNPFMLFRFTKQQRMLAVIKQTFSLPVRLVELADTEIKGIAALRKLGRALFIEPVGLEGYSPDASLPRAEVSPPPSPRVDGSIRRLLLPNKGSRRTIFFAGKGGVGKTSVAAATALWVARRGYRTLLVTTDPASHLAQVFEQEVTGEPALISGEENMWAARIDAPAAAREYKERVLSEMRGKYDETRVRAISEELDSPCTEEMATFEKFIEFATRKDFDVIVFDTAPTGHTLRLLKLPVEWNKQLEIKIFTTAESEADKAAKSKFGEVIAMMQDRDDTTFSFVMYPESTPIEEAARAMADLSGIGVKTGLVVANMVLPDSIATNDYIKSRKAMQQMYLEQMAGRFDAPIASLCLLEDDLVGKERLVQAGNYLYGE